jgi:hypothetical protein
MKAPDVDKVRSEKKLTMLDFLKSYNQGLPSQFPAASQVLLKEFYNSNSHLFKDADVWTLDQHRKKVMDWIPQHLGI